MQDIQDHERRLSVALARIGAAIDRLSEPPPAAFAEPETDSAAEVEIARLGRALATEQARSLALQEDLDRLLTREAATMPVLEAELARQQGLLETQGAELSRLRSVSQQLRDALRGLREALEGGVLDAALINQALRAELDSLRAARQIDASEIDLLLGTLEPLVADAEAARRADDSQEGK